jgi:hypothetical protein
MVPWYHGIKVFIAISPNCVERFTWLSPQPKPVHGTQNNQIYHRGKLSAMRLRKLPKLSEKGHELSADRRGDGRGGGDNESVDVEMSTSYTAQSNYAST